MSLLDIVILVCLIYNGYVGLRRGFFRLVLDVLALGASTVAGLMYYATLSHWITATFPSITKYSAVLSFGLICLALFMVVSGISTLLNRILDRTLILGPIDRLLGLGVGIVKGLVFLLPILVPLYYFNVPSLDRSIFSKPLKPLIAKISHSMKTRL